MGYYVDMHVNAFRIPAANIPAALEAMNRMHDDDVLLAKARGGAYGDMTSQTPVRKRKWYSWVANPSVKGWPDIVTAIGNWGFDGFIGDFDDFVVKKSPEYKKIGQEDELFKVIAPYMSQLDIECRGEDGEKWKWVVENGKFAEKQAVITWR